MNTIIMVDTTIMIDIKANIHQTTGTLILVLKGDLENEVTDLLKKHHQHSSYQKLATKHLDEIISSLSEFFQFESTQKFHEMKIFK